MYFSRNFLNKDISLTTRVKCLNYFMCILYDHKEGKVSQILYIGPSFDFMESRKMV